MKIGPFVRQAIRTYWFDDQKYRYHFIHIPKNAGVSVRRALSLEPSVSFTRPYHYRYRDVADKVGRHLRFFAVIRNPWSRTASRYFFARQSALKWPENDPRRQYILNATFSDYVRDQKILPIPKHPGQPWMGPLSSWFNQLEWIQDERGAVVCDCLRMEHLAHDLPHYLNVPLKLDRQNVTVVPYDYRAMYTDQLAEVIGELFKEDIEYFGFSFDGPATRHVETPDS